MNSNQKFKKSTLVVQITIILLITATSRPQPVQRYWTKSYPSLNLPYPIPTFFSRSVIKYNQDYVSSGTRLSSYIDLTVTHSQYSIFGVILVLSVSCNTYYPHRDNNGNVYYWCNNGYLSYLENNSVSSEGTFLPLMYLKLSSGGEFSSVSSLDRGFTLTSTLKKDTIGPYIFTYNAGGFSLTDVTSIYKYARMPYGGLTGLLIFQLAILITLAYFKDKRRVPMFTIYLVALGYIPFFGLMNRGTFVVSNSGFKFLAFFGVISIFIICFSLCATASRKREKKKKCGAFTVFALFIVFTLSTIVAQGLGIYLIIAIPVFLVVEKLFYSRHNWLGALTWLLTAAQGMSYVMILWSDDAMKAALLPVEADENGFPVLIYLVVSFISLLFCARGKHVKMSDDWLTAVGPRLVNQGARSGQPNGANKSSEGGETSFDTRGGSTSNYQAAQDAQGYGGNEYEYGGGGNFEPDKHDYDPF